MPKRVKNIPIAENTFEAASSFGNYNLALSLADLVDNSISANANEIRIYADFDGINSSLSIIDNGKGMSRDELFNAMRLASFNPKESREKNDLGRFGLGMKTASFALGRKLTVLSCQNQKLTGASWDLDNIQDFIMDEYNHEETKNKLKFDHLDPQTQVSISKLERLTEKGSIKIEDWERILVEAKDELRLIFHRYLEGVDKDLKKIKIFFNDDINPLSPINPFYQDHPATQNLGKEVLNIDGNKIAVTPFILPHFTKLPPGDYDKLAGREGYIRNQGFYIYRNSRLIIKGTWFKLIPHGELVKLARIKVDIPNSLDEEWKITVDKSDAQIPIKVQKRLKALILKIQSQSSKVFTHKGKQISNTRIAHIWNLTQRMGKKSFKINEKHPIISGYIDDLDNKKSHKFKSVLKMIEETVPLQEIVAEMNDKPDTVHQVSTEPNLILDAAKFLYFDLQSKGMDANEILEMFGFTHPFNMQIEYILKMFNEEGIINTNVI